MQAPLIAVAGYRLPVGRVKGWDATGIAIPGYYLNAVKRAGGEPAIVSGPSSNGVLDRFDALLLVGGGDVAPSRYGAEAHPEVYGTDPERDEFELALVPAAIAIGKPVLAICRGIQVLNVGLGGTLQQHLADRPGAIPHGEPTSDKPWVEHRVKLDESSHLAEACGG